MKMWGANGYNIVKTHFIHNIYPCYPQYISSTTYTLRTHNVYPQYNQGYMLWGMYCGRLYVLWVCIVGETENVVHNIYRGGLYCGRHECVVDNTGDHVIHNINNVVHNTYPTTHALQHCGQPIVGDNVCVVGNNVCIVEHTL